MFFIHLLELLKVSVLLIIHTVPFGIPYGTLLFIKKAALLFAAYSHLPE